MVETESDAILQNADHEDVALLVVGDPFGCSHFLFAQLHRHPHLDYYALCKVQQHIQISFSVHDLSKSLLESFTTPQL